MKKMKTIFKQKKDFKKDMGNFLIQKWEDNRYVLTDFPLNLNGDMVFVLTECNLSNKYNPIGIASIVVSKDELEEWFEETGEIIDWSKIYGEG